MARILVLNGHPNPAASFAGNTILKEFLALEDQVTVRNLSEQVHDGHFDVAAEHACLLDADILVWHFPLYWYSVPAVMKLWIDTVLTHGFAFGTNGTALKGKKVVLSFTAGAGQDKYVKGGAMGWPVEAFLPPLLQTVRLCSMEALDPVFSTGMNFIEGVSLPEDRTRIQTQARSHAQRLFDVISRNEVYAS